MKNFFKKSSLMSVFLCLSIFSVSFAEPMNINKEDIQKIEEQQSVTKENASKNLSNYFKDINELNKVGALYWEGEELVLGIKQLPENYMFLESSDFKVKKINYTTEELINKMEEAERVFLDTESIDNLVTVSTREDIGKIEITAKSINEVTRKKLEEKYGKEIIITVDNSLERPQMEISRFRDWTVLGGGIAGTRYSNSKDCTIAGIGVKNGEYYLITAGHGVTNIGSNYYQFKNKVGVQHTNAAYYNSSDIGLIKIQNSNLISSNGSKVSRRISNKLYLNDENNSNYSGSISSVNAWPAAGDIVTKSGGTTGTTSGKVISAYTKCDYGDGYPTVYCAKVSPIGVSRYSAGGDSGSPTFYNSSSNNKVLVGVHTGGDTKNGFFAPAHQIYSSFGDNFTVYTSNYETTVN